LSRETDPERFERMMNTAAAWAKSVQQSGSPLQRTRHDWSYLGLMQRHKLVQVNRWLSAIGSN